MFTFHGKIVFFIQLLVVFGFSFYLWLNRPIYIYIYIGDVDWSYLHQPSNIMCNQSGGWSQWGLLSINRKDQLIKCVSSELDDNWFRISQFVVCQHWTVMNVNNPQRRLSLIDLQTKTKNARTYLKSLVIETWYLGFKPLDCWTNQLWFNQFKYTRCLAQYIYSPAGKNKDLVMWSFVSRDKNMLAPERQWFKPAQNKCGGVPHSCTVEKKRREITRLELARFCNHQKTANISNMYKHCLDLSI